MSERPSADCDARAGLRRIWREAAEQGIEQGIDWPRVVLDLFHQLDDAEAEAHNLAHEVDRVRERLWRLAALAGWRSGNPADNDATAELYVTEALRTRCTPPAMCPGCGHSSPHHERWGCMAELGDAGSGSVADAVFCKCPTPPERPSDD